MVGRPTERLGSIGRGLFTSFLGIGRPSRASEADRASGGVKKRLKSAVEMDFYHYRCCYLYCQTNDGCLFQSLHSTMQ